MSMVLLLYYLNGVLTRGSMGSVLGFSNPSIFEFTAKKMVKMSNIRLQLGPMKTAPLLNKYY